MNIALCYESVLAARGGAETYIGDLARRLAKDGHIVHLYACRWDASRLPESTVYHKLEVSKRPRFLRPWRFARACERALAEDRPDISMGFDKTWGQDVLYPQGGLHAASRVHNLLKFRNPIVRFLAECGKRLDPASWSFARLERKQYLGPDKPIVIVNSFMVREHFQRFYGIGPERVRVIRSSIDPLRFAAEDRSRRREEERGKWGVAANLPVGLFVAMNYRLKGLAPLIRAVARVPKERDFKIAVVGHPKFAAYARLAKRLGADDRMLFLGFRGDPRDAYFAADFLVHPTFYDPCSLVVLEALACGLPVITSRYNGASELLTPATGFVIDDPHNSQGLAAMIEKILDPDWRCTAAHSAREAARQWTFEQHYRALTEVFEEVRARKE